jgi:sirohydrochlorin ferrochelatase
VDLVAAALGAALGRPCRAGYASGAGRPVDAAVRSLRDQGPRSIAAASYFLAPGLLYARACTMARDAGVSVVAEPLADEPALAALVRHRASQARHPRIVLAAA